MTTSGFALGGYVASLRSLKQHKAETEANNRLRLYLAFCISCPSNIKVWLLCVISCPSIKKLANRLPPVTGLLLNNVLFLILNIIH